MARWPGISQAMASSTVQSCRRPRCPSLGAKPRRRRRLGAPATMTASWLKQMGWSDVAVLVADPTDGDRVTGPHKPRTLGIDGARTDTIQPIELRKRLSAGDGITVIDLDTSRNYGQGHIPGAWFAIRSHLRNAIASLPQAGPIVLASPDGALAQLAAAAIPGHATAPDDRPWR